MNKQSSPNNIFVVLVRPSISGNIGAVARCMANFGFSNLILVDSKCEINDEARNRAKHAQKVLNSLKIESSLKNAVSSFGTVIATTGVLGSDYNIARTSLLVEDASKKINTSKGNIGLVFGPEETGLSNEELELCDFAVTIPTSKNYPVMNLSHAVSIFLYELSKCENSKPITKQFPLISGKEKDVLHAELIAVINSVKYRTPFEKRTQLLVWKRVIGKAMPTKRETFAMIGLLKKISRNQKEEFDKKEKKKVILKKVKKQ